MLAPPPKTTMSPLRRACRTFAASRTLLRKTPFIEPKSTIENVTGPPAAPSSHRSSACLREMFMGCVLDFKSIALPFDRPIVNGAAAAEEPRGEEHVYEYSVDASEETVVVRTNLIMLDEATSATRQFKLILNCGRSILNF